MESWSLLFILGRFWKLIIWSKVDIGKNDMSIAEKNCWWEWPWFVHHSLVILNYLSRSFAI